MSCMTQAKEPLPQDKQAAIRYEAALLKEHPWIAPPRLGKRIDTVMNENSGTASKRRKLYQIIDEASAAIYPNSACRGAGCSHCCKTSVMIRQAEADAIGKKIGRTARKVAYRDPEKIKGLAFDEKYAGSTCPFLVDEKCSVYDVRPYVCRQAHSLNASPDQCDTSKVRASDSCVIHFDLTHLEFAMSHVCEASGDALGDIREFFPTLHTK